MSFIVVGIDTLKTPEIIICMAIALAKDSRFAIICSDDRQARKGIYFNHKWRDGEFTKTCRISRDLRLAL